MHFFFIRLPDLTVSICFFYVAFAQLPGVQRIGSVPGAVREWGELCRTSCPLTMAVGLTKLFPSPGALPS